MMIRYLQARAGTATNHDAVFVEPEGTLRQAARLMWKHDIGALVVGRPEHAIGMLSERDIATHLARGEDPDVITTQTAMTPCLVTVREGDFLSDAAVKMLDDGLRHVPVTDQVGRVIGMLSVRDLLRPLLLDALASPQQGGGRPD
jgi:CBS domain-containing protein